MADAPPTMQALQVSDLLGDYAGVALREVDTPAPGPGEVQVQVLASAVGFPDLLMTEGKYQHKPDLPFILGGEMAGLVTAIGDGVTWPTPGTAVVGGGLGSFAGYGLYRAEGLRPLPAGLEFARAAATASAYLTAYVSLVRRAALQPGEWLLVHGAAGGVGLAAVDLGRHLGARVIAAASSEEKLATIQAEYAPDATLISRPGFRDEVKAITGGGADVIYDPVGGDVFDESIRCIAFDGRLLVVGFASGRIPNVPANMPLIKGFSVVGVRAGEYGRRFPLKGKENLDAVWRLVADGAVRPRVHGVFALEDWRDAFAEIERRRTVGRVILAPHGAEAARARA